MTRLLGSVRTAVAVWIVVVGLGLGSTYQYAMLPNEAIDYQSLARGMGRLMRSGDVVVIENAWWAQPLHYYLPAGQVETVGGLQALARRPGGGVSTPGRVWLIGFGRNEVAAERLQALASKATGYVEVERVSALGVVAGLFEPR
jgi:hypothetical protein